MRAPILRLTERAIVAYPVVLCISVHPVKYLQLFICCELYFG